MNSTQKWILLLFVILFLTPASYAYSSEDKVIRPEEKANILIVHSYHHDFSWTNALHEGITYDAIQNNWNIYVEYLDTYRKDTSSLELIKEHILYNYSDLDIEAVVVTDNDAYNVMTSLMPEHFKDVPLLFAGLNNVETDQVPPFATGIMQNTDISGLLELIPDLFPSTKRLIVVGTDSKTASNIFNELADINNAQELPLDMIPLLESDLELQLSALKELTSKDTCIYVAGSHDSLNHNEYAKLIEATADRPTFVGVSVALDGNVFGGYVIDPMDHGLTINTMLEDLLDNSSVSSIPVIVEPLQSIQFNYNSMQRYGILQSNLPEGSTIINKPSSNITINRMVLNAIILSLFFTSLMILLLLYLMRMRRHYTEELLLAKNELQESNMELEAHTEELISSQEELDHQYHELQENKIIVQKLADYDQVTDFMQTHKFTSFANTKLNAADEVHIIYITMTNLEDTSYSLGFDLYESLLKIVANKIQALMNPKDYFFGIIQGDDILICCTKEAEQMHQDVDELIKIFEFPFYSDYFSIRLNAHFGVASYPKDGNDADLLVKCAGIAAMTSIPQNNTGAAFFETTMQDLIFKEQKRQAEIDMAIKEKEFILHLQPKYNLKGKTVVGYEALIRWQRADGSLLYPGAFIDLAEKTGQILEIGEMVIQMVCRLIRNNQLDKTGLHIALNLSSQHFEDHKIIRILDDAVDTFGISPHCIELEITETSLLQNFELTKELLKTLRSKGYSIALDDFGTGYSSLSYIRNLPIDKIKIDRSFISQIPDEKYMKVLKAIVSLSKELDYKVNIEGIETKEQWNLLLPLSPDELQGYFFSKPLPTDQALALISSI